MNDNSILRMLIGSIAFFLVCLFYAEHRFPNDGQLFQVIASLVTGFSGAFLMFIKNKLGVHDDPAVQRTTDTVTTTVSASQEKQS